MVQRLPREVLQPAEWVVARGANARKVANDRGRAGWLAFRLRVLVLHLMVQNPLTVHFEYIATLEHQP